MNPVLRIVACVFLVLTAAALHLTTCEWVTYALHRDERQIFDFLRYRAEVGYMGGVLLGIIAPLCLAFAAVVVVIPRKTH